MFTCPNCKCRDPFTDLLAHSNLPFLFGTSHTPHQSLRSINYRTGEWLFIYYLQRKNSTTSCSLIIDMFELDEVQSHTPSLSSSLQAVCLCVRPLGRLGVCVVYQSRQQTALSSWRSLLFCPCWTLGYHWNTLSNPILHSDLELEKDKFQLLTQKLNLTDCWTIPHPTTLTG